MKCSAYLEAFVIYFCLERSRRLLSRPSFDGGIALWQYDAQSLKRAKQFVIVVTRIVTRPQNPMAVSGGDNVRNSNTILR